MTYSKYGIAFLILSIATAPALAGHVKPGQWNVTSTVRFSGPEKFPPMVIGKLATQGVVYPDHPVTVNKSVCISPEAAAVDRLPTQDADDGSCDPLSFETTSDGFSGKTVCHGYLVGRVWFKVSFTGDSHYEGSTVFKGSTFGLALESRNNFSGDWNAADCNVATP
jgi:hypothetical protein